MKTMETNQRDAILVAIEAARLFAIARPSHPEAVRVISALTDAKAALASAPAVEAPRDDSMMTCVRCGSPREDSEEVAKAIDYLAFSAPPSNETMKAIRTVRAALQPSATQPEKPLLERIKDSADKFDALPEARKATMLKDAARPAGYVNDIHVVDLSEPIDKPHSYTITEAKAEGRKEGIEAAYDTLAKLEKTYSERGNTAAADILLVAGINVAALAEAPTDGEKG